MTEWGVFTIFTSIVVFLVTICTVVVKVTRTINDNTNALELLSVTLKEFKADNKTSHDKIWHKFDDVDKEVNDHETRITVLEKRNL